MSTNICPRLFHRTVRQLRQFFESELGFVEVPTQSRLSILAACEDPATISTFHYESQQWPLPQTGQMWLEYEMLKNPELPGLFCLSTSYRNEPNPVEGRHNKIFPMFEFEIKGGFEELIDVETRLLKHLGYSEPYVLKDYQEVSDQYDVLDIGHEHEMQLAQEHGPAVLLTNFPRHTSPFWNMKHVGDTARKVDVILSGQETIGSAERSTNPEEMRRDFLTISDGMYAKTLYNQFGKERVNRELDEFLDLDFFPRSGGGIGVTRLIRSLQEENLMEA